MKFIVKIIIILPVIVFLFRNNAYAEEIPDIEYFTGTESSGSRDLQYEAETINGKLINYYFRNASVYASENTGNGDDENWSSGLYHIIDDYDSFGPYGVFWQGSSDNCYLEFRFGKSVRIDYIYILWYGGLTENSGSFCVKAAEFQSNYFTARMWHGIGYYDGYVNSNNRRWYRYDMSFQGEYTTGAYLRIYFDPSLNKNLRVDEIRILGQGTDRIPTVPGNLTASPSVANSTVTLTWDDSFYEDGYRIERKLAGGSYYQIAEVGSSTTSFTDTSLSFGNVYYYRIYAYNNYANSGYSNEAAAVMGYVPQAPANLTATPSPYSTGTIYLSWNEYSNDELGFRIERSTDGSNWAQISVTGANTIGYTDTGLVPGTRYYYRVCAYNNIGNSGYSNVSSTVTGCIPQAPSGLTATASVDTASIIYLSWNDNSANELGFKIEISTDGAYWAETALTGANAVSFANTNLSAGTGYYYRVRAYNNYGNSAYTNTAYAQTLPPPPAPTNFTILSYTHDTVVMSWQHNCTYEDGFKIERSINGFNWMPAGITGSDVMNYTDTGLTPETTYFYRVCAYDTITNSDFSNL